METLIKNLEVWATLLTFISLQRAASPQQTNACYCHCTNKWCPLFGRFIVQRLCSVNNCSSTLYAYTYYRSTSESYRIAGIFQGYKFLRKCLWKVFADLLFLWNSSLFAACMHACNIKFVVINVRGIIIIMINSQKP